MDSDENLKQLTSVDAWNETYKAVPVADYQSKGTSDATYGDQYGGKPGAKITEHGTLSKVELGSVPLAEESDLSLMRVQLKDLEISAQDLWKKCTGLIESMQSVDPMFDDPNKKAYGITYNNSNFAEYLMGLYQVPSKKYVLSFRRMSGDGFSMNDFYQNMNNKLAEAKMSEPEFEDESDFDDLFDDDEDDSSGSFDLIKPGCYLTLKLDKELVVSWVEDFEKKSLEDQQHIMGVMAYNAEQETNRNIMIEMAEKQIKVAIIFVLEGDNAALVRYASKLLRILATNNKCRDSELAKLCLKTINRFVPGPVKSHKHFHVKHSRGTIRELVEA
eukprot:UN34844